MAVSPSPSGARSVVVATVSNQFFSSTSASSAPASRQPRSRTSSISSRDSRSLSIDSHRPLIENNTTTTRMFTNDGSQVRVGRDRYGSGSSSSSGGGGDNDNQHRRHHDFGHGDDLEEGAIMGATRTGISESSDGSTAAARRDKNLRRISRKLDLWLIPLLSVLYLCNGLDRGNIGNAETQGESS